MQIPNSLPSPLRILLQTSLQEFLKAWVDIQRNQVQIRFARDDRCQHIADGLAMKCLRAREHFVEDGTEREDVAACVAAALF
jgi:hypothetical protein